MSKLTFLLMSLFTISQSIHAQEDKYLWLEEVDGEKALSFVNEKNTATIKVLSAEKDYPSIYNKSLQILNAADKIAYPNIKGKYVYNFWKDKDHERGIWRRCLLSNYTQKKYEWETLLDIDALSKQDNVKWVFKGSSGLYPNYNRFLISLSNGGGDAIVIKEFDVDKKEFVKDGFYIPESKGGASYVDENTLCVSSDFGEGTMSTAGYPIQTKLWKRGTALKDAQLIYEGTKTDVGAWGGILRDGNKGYVFVNRAITFFTAKYSVWVNNSMVTLDVPEDCAVSGLFHNQLLVQLKSNWIVSNQTFTSGSLVGVDFTKLLQGKKEVHLIIAPDQFSSISETLLTTQNHLLINLLTNVTSTLFSYTFSNNTWRRTKVNAPELGNISLSSADEFSDQYFFTYENFITPSTLYAADAGKNSIKPIQSLPAYFDAGKYEVKQFTAKSKDGTLVPYFMVAAKNIQYNGSNPTLLYAYGGFEVSLQPNYTAVEGTAWLERGGVYVLANLRGGGEFGPKWHQDGMKEKRQNVFDDLYAVAEDLIARKVTSPRHLGVEGGSNGGLLVGVAFTQRPDLFNAVLCEVPLLDMKRYNKLLAGASWMGEYGNPDVEEEWAYIQKYSPYQNVKEGMKYPEVFFTTSTRDDRVHPGHARKMVAKMTDMGYQTFYYENTEGGHAGSSTNEQSAKLNALMFSYLLMKLK